MHLVHLHQNDFLLWLGNPRPKGVWGGEEWGKTPNFWSERLEPRPGQWVGTRLWELQRSWLCALEAGWRWTSDMDPGSLCHCRQGRRGKLAAIPKLTCQLTPLWVWTLLKGPPCRSRKHSWWQGCEWFSLSSQSRPKASFFPGGYFQANYSNWDTVASSKLLKTATILCMDVRVGL